MLEESGPLRCPVGNCHPESHGDRKSTRLNSSHLVISYAVFCLKKKKNSNNSTHPYSVASYGGILTDHSIAHLIPHSVHASGVPRGGVSRSAHRTRAELSLRTRA